MRILLAIDGSSYSDVAVAEVANKPFPANSEVKIISVAELPILPVVDAWAPTDNYFQVMEKFAEEQAQRIVRKPPMSFAIIKETSCELQPQSSRVIRDTSSLMKRRPGALT